MAKTTPIKIRVEPSQHTLLTKVAKVLHIDCSTFILKAACREAENVLLDRRLFQLNEDEFAAFEAALDAPVPNTARLKTLLKTPAPWD